jgi:hypothetical protein
MKPLTAASKLYKTKPWAEICAFRAAARQFPDLWESFFGICKDFEDARGLAATDLWDVFSNLCMSNCNAPILDCRPTVFMLFLEAVKATTSIKLLDHGRQEQSS